MFKRIVEWHKHRKNNEIKEYCRSRKCKKDTYQRIISEEIGLRVIRKHKRTARFCRLGPLKFYRVPYYVCECLECGNRRRVVKSYDRISEEEFDKLKQIHKVFGGPIL